MTEIRRYHPIIQGSPGEDISKKDLHAIIQRFKSLNQLRQQRVQSYLTPRQQIFLQLLPLLFHQNQPLLPGFISLETAAGIPDYTPNKQTRLAAKQFSKGFTYKRKALLKYSIQGIFLMGSVSSLAFSKSSDLDIWLCYQPELLEPEIYELQQKATKIEKWADSYDLEVHFFLINSEQFSKGENIPISTESSGNTQHYLLLEEFYRTSIFIAGRTPAWWLVPPDQEHNYSAYLSHLIENRFINANEVIDFGGLELIPAEEFISATLWHIYKALNAPYKSLLKLFLMEAYASEYPQPEWLCFKLKEAIYRGTFDLELLDPYFLIYSKIEKYLLDSESTHRINLARQCFYLKLIGSSSTETDYKSQQYREEYLHAIAKQWGWSEDLLPTFKKQKYWDIKKAAQEHIVIRNQLNQCLRIVLRLASEYVDYNYRNNKDLKLISRKLHASLERKPGKIEIITTRSFVYRKKNELSIIESDIEDDIPIWTLYAGKFNLQNSSSSAIIKQDYNLLDLLGWLVINGLYNKQIKLHIKSSSLVISHSELLQILDSLFQFLSGKLKTKTSPLSIYNKANRQLSALIFINLGLAIDELRNDGLMVISERSDPLSYGKNRQCFIQQIEQISISSWGEVTTAQYTGKDGFFDCLTNVFNNSQQPVSTEHLKSVCFIPGRAKSITLRIDAIFANLVKYYSRLSTEKNHRYIVASEHSYTIFQNKNDFLQHWTVASKELLLQELSNAQDTFSPVHFDSYVLEDTLIPYLYSLNLAQIIQVFYLKEGADIHVYIIDEKAALFIHEHKQSNPNHILKYYSIFLESLLIHTLYNDIALKFYEIQKNSAGVYSSHSANWDSKTTYIDLSLRIIMEDLASITANPIYYIYCNDIEFTSIVHGNDIFEVVSSSIMAFRKNKENYPIHITEIDVPCSFLGVENDSQLQTIHFLNYKKEIETKLNI